jgi:hypothetical protein
MYQVIRWMEELALCEQGSNLVEGTELDRRVEALRELQRNWRNMNGRQFREVMTVAHFTDYFADALDRAFYSDYQYQVGDWRDFTYPDEVPDFRDVKRFRMGEPGTLHKRREKAEAKASKISPSVVQYGVEEFSRQFDVSWRAVLNDDLGKIQETPQRMANAAGRFEDEFVSNLYDNATTQAALVALGALYAGTGRLTAANLAVGLNALMQRTDADGNKINIRRVHLVIPSILKIQAATVLSDIISYGGPNSNVLQQWVASVKVDPYISVSGADVPWYLVADPAEIPSITVARLRGVPGAFTYMKASNIDLISGSAPSAFLMGSAETGDIEYFVEDIIGGWDDSTYVGVTDYRGIYYSSGTTA